MKLFSISEKKKEKIKAIGYEGVAIASGEFGLALKEAEVILPQRASMKLMEIV